jgi:hypothetical protein
MATNNDDLDGNVEGDHMQELGPVVSKAGLRKR